MLQRGGDTFLRFEVNAFFGNEVLLKGVEVPVYTLAQQNHLIRLARGKKNLFLSGIRKDEKQA